LDNINGVKDKICAGISEFNISPIEPISIDKIVIYDTDNLKLFLKDVKISKSKFWKLKFQIENVFTQFTQRIATPSFRLHALHAN